MSVKCEKIPYGFISFNFAISAAFFFWDFEGNNTTRKVLHFLYVETKARDSLVLSR